MAEGRGTKPTNPNTWDFIEYTIKPLARRLLEGEDRQIVGEELFRAVLPWVKYRINCELSHLPSGADPAEIRSRMMDAAYRVSLAFDPSCPQSWPTALKQKLHGAWLDAYRAADFITRKHRALHNIFRANVEAAIHERGRELSQDEQMEIAKKVAPNSSMTDWATVIVNHTPPPPVGGDALEFLGNLSGQSHDLTDPAEIVARADTSEQIEHWMNGLPIKLRNNIMNALRDGRTISDKARRTLEGLEDKLPALQEIISGAESVSLY